MAIKLGGLELATPGDIVVGGGACAAGALSLKYAIQTTLGSKKSAPEREADEPSTETTQSEGKPKSGRARKRKIQP